jgi:hypothetical protein
MLRKTTVHVSFILLLSQASPLVAQDEEPGLVCGPQLSCDAGSQYCSVVEGGPNGMATGFSCIDVPDATTAPSCSTIHVPIGSQCTDTEDGVIVSTRAP